MKMWIVERESGEDVTISADAFYMDRFKERTAVFETVHKGWLFESREFVASVTDALLVKPAD